MIFRTLRAGLLLLPILSGWVQLHSQDVGDFLLSKSLSYTQSTPGMPVLLPSPFSFYASATSANGGLLGGAIGIPGGAVLPLISDASGLWSAGSTYRTAAALEADYPSGNYGVQFHTTHDGEKRLTLAFAAGAFPNGPQILNFQAAQTVAPASEFAVTWAPFVGGSAADFIRVSVSSLGGQVVYKTRGYGKIGALNGTVTSTTIPAGTLSAGQTYSATVLFAKGVGQNTDYGQGVIGTTAFLTQTVFPLVTVDHSGTSDVASFGVLKGVHYRQSGAGAPAIADTEPYEMNVFAKDIDGGLLGGGIKLPDGSVRPFGVTQDGLGINATYLSPASLDAAFPPGTYTVTLNTVHNGIQTIALPLPASGFPNAPQVMNYSAAQAVNPSAAFVVSWNAFTGGTANDFVQLQVDVLGVDQSVFQTPQPGQPGALNGTSTSATIPAATLASGQVYQVRLVFARVLALSRSYSLGVSAYFSQTELVLSTTGTAVPPTLSVSRTGPTQWLLHAAGGVGRNCVLQSAPSLDATALWQPVVAFVGSTSGFEFLDGVARPQTFYRVLVVD